MYTHSHVCVCVCIYTPNAHAYERQMQMRMSKNVAYMHGVWLWTWWRVRMRGRALVRMLVVCRALVGRHLFFLQTNIDSDKYTHRTQCLPTHAPAHGCTRVHTDRLPCTCSVAAQGCTHVHTDRVHVVLLHTGVHVYIQTWKASSL